MKKALAALALLAFASGIRAAQNGVKLPPAGLPSVIIEPGGGAAPLIVIPTPDNPVTITDARGTVLRVIPAAQEGAAPTESAAAETAAAPAPREAPVASAAETTWVYALAGASWIGAPLGSPAHRSIVAGLAQAAERRVPGDQLFDGAAAAPAALASALEAVLGRFYSVSGGSRDGGDVSAARITTAQRTAIFRSAEFKAWATAEKAAGRQVFWLRDIDKTQASGDIFTYFFRWRARNGGFSAEQNQLMRGFLKTVSVKDAALAAELSRVDANDARANAELVIKLWRSKAGGGEGISMLDFWSKVYWPTQQGLSREEKLRQAAAFAPEYASQVYAGIPEENRALAEAGVEVVAVSNGDQDLAVAAAPLLGLRSDNVVGSNPAYDPEGFAKGFPHAYEISEPGWEDKPQPGKHLSFHYWVNTHKARWGWDRLDKGRIVIAGADGDSASSDGGMWVYFPDKAIGNFMVDTPHEPGRILKSRGLAAKYGWGGGRFFTLIPDPNGPKDWDDGPDPKP